MLRRGEEKDGERESRGLLMIRFNPAQAEIHISTIASNLSLQALFPLLTRIKQ